METVGSGQAGRGVTMTRGSVEGIHVFVMKQQNVGKLRNERNEAEYATAMKKTKCVVIIQ